MFHINYFSTKITDLKRIIIFTDNLYVRRVTML